MTEVLPSLENVLADVQSGLIDEARMIEMFVGVDEQGRNIYAYMAIIPSRYMEYRTRLANGEEIDLEDYGEIIEEGYGILPPVELQKKMEALGFDHHYEARLEQMIAQAQEASR